MSTIPARCASRSACRLLVIVCVTWVGWIAGGRRTGSNGNIGGSTVSTMARSSIQMSQTKTRDLLTLFRQRRRQPYLFGNFHQLIGSRQRRQAIWENQQMQARGEGSMPGQAPNPVNVQSPSDVRIPAEDGAVYVEDTRKRPMGSLEE
eukprot:1392211-Amorphochlora_amoeboformis.AAC.1